MSTKTDDAKDLIEGEFLLLEWLEKNAVDISVIDDSDETFPYNKKVYAVVNGRLMNVVFSLFMKDKESSITFIYNGVTDRDLTLKQLIQRLENIQP